VANNGLPSVDQPSFGTQATNHSLTDGQKQDVTGTNLPAAVVAPQSLQGARR
jgi:hypothetical protein